MQKKIYNFDFFYTSFFLILPISIVAGNMILNLNIFFILIFTFFKFFHVSIKLKNNFIFFLKIFGILIFFNLIFGQHIGITFKGILGVIKNFFLFISLLLFFSDEVREEKFVKAIYFVILLVSIDTLIQYIFDYDLFLNKIDFQHGKRLSGPFGSELVVGAYISKLMFIAISYFLYINKNYIFQIFSLFFFLTIIFLSQERSAFYISCISTLLFLLCYSVNIKKKFLFFLLLTTLIYGLSLNDKSLKEKYVDTTFSQIGIFKSIDKTGYKKIGDVNIDSFWDSRYGAHFLTAIEIFKKYKFFGSGIKSFRLECAKSEYENIKSNYKELRCNTHPHNFYLEFLAEGGVTLFLLLIFIIFWVTFLNLKLLFDGFKIKYIINLAIINILFFPIQTTGSFFSTFNGVFYWIGLAYIFHSSHIHLFNFNSKKNR